MAKHQTALENASALVADVLFVRVPQASIIAVPPEVFSHAHSGREALEMLKTLRFRLLVASLAIPDMPAWELFHLARQKQSRLQCILLDEKMTSEDEQRVREAGAGAFTAIDPALLAFVIGAPRQTV